LSSVQSNLLGDFQMLGVHDTALVRPPKPVVDLVLHLRPSVARPLVIDAACCCVWTGRCAAAPIVGAVFIESCSAPEANGVLASWSDCAAAGCP